MKLKQIQNDHKWVIVITSEIVQWDMSKPNPE